MRFKGWIAASVLLLAGFSAHAQLAENCIPQTEMLEIARSFPQFNSLTNKSEYCFDNSQESRLIQGIMFMRKTAFTPSMPRSSDDLFSGNFATSWWDYFIGRINEFDVQSSCPKGVGAFVYFFGNTMYVCPYALSTNFTSLDLASVFMHEARHIDGFPHVTCSRGPRAGIQGACDRRIGEGGSYAVSVETYAQLGQYATDLHPALKAYAKSSAVIYADEAFDQPTRIDRTPALLVMTNDQNFHSIDLSTMKIDQKGQSPFLGHIVMRAQHMILYPEDKAQQAKFVFANNEGELPQTAGELATEYNGLSPAQRGDWVDVHIGGQWSAKVLKTKLVIGCDPRAATTQDVSTNGEVPKAILYTNGYSRGDSSAQLLMESGQIYDFGCQSKNPFLRRSSVQLDQEFKRIHKSGTTIVGLGTDGKLYKIENGRSALLSTSLDGRIYELAPAESYGFFN